MLGLLKKDSNVGNIRAFKIKENPIKLSGDPLILAPAPSINEYPPIKKPVQIANNNAFLSFKDFFPVKDKLKMPNEINKIPINSKAVRVTPKKKIETIVTITGPVPRAVGYTIV